MPAAAGPKRNTRNSANAGSTNNMPVRALRPASGFLGRLCRGKWVSTMSRSHRRSGFAASAASARACRGDFCPSSAAWISGESTPMT